MDKVQIWRLKNKISQVKIVSFDLYGTLIFRKVRQPQDIFAFMECCTGIADFQRERIKMQIRAARYVKKTYGWPHPSLHEIYQYWQGSNNHPGLPRMRNIHEIDLDKRFLALEKLERRLEEGLCIANPAMLGIMAYARRQGKRVVVTTDMYLERFEIEKILKRCSITQWDAIYASSEIRKTKYDGTMYGFVMEQENAAAKEILHIGDDGNADIKMAGKRNIRTFWYQDWQRDLAESLYLEAHSCNEEPGGMRKDGLDFWYVLGYQAGGPLYMGLCTWMKRNGAGGRVYALSRDGYHLAKLMPLFGEHGYRYLLSSRKAMLLPHIARLGRRELELLPPYSCGQTIGEALACAGLMEIPEQEFKKAGFRGYGDVIHSRKDIADIKKVYRKNEKQILQICARERSYMEKYFRAQGLPHKGMCFFDSGWSGTSQYLIERFYRALHRGHRLQIRFCYAGIKKDMRARHMMSGRDYSSYLNQYLGKREIRQMLASSAVLELFFSEDSPPLQRYGKHGPVFGAYRQREYIRAVNQGIEDYVRQNQRLFSGFRAEAVERFGAKGLCRLALHPNAREAQRIGDLADIDGMSAGGAMEKYIARIPKESLRKNPFLDIYWEQGIYKHPQNTMGVKLFVWLRQRAAGAIKVIRNLNQRLAWHRLSET